MKLEIFLSRCEAEQKIKIGAEDGVSFYYGGHRQQSSGETDTVCGGTEKALRRLRETGKRTAAGGSDPLCHARGIPHA